MDFSAQLTLEVGEAKPEAFVLEAEKPASIGRHRTNQIVLHDEHASRHHAEVYFEDACWYVRDIEALNRTQVNGKVILGPTPLPNDARIKVGRTVLQFSVTSTAADPDVWHYPTADNDESSLHLQTALMPDEMTVLYQFNSQALKTRQSRDLILLGLQTLQSFMPEARVLFTTLAEGDGSQPDQLPEASDLIPSEQLTREVQNCRKAVWIGDPRNDQAIEESLYLYSDALGLPIGVEGPPTGMLHVYRLRDQFNERTVHFCELLAGNLSHWLTNLRTVSNLRADNNRLRAQVSKTTTLIGDSKSLDKLKQQIQRAAQRESSVLICGESGVGKELVATALHRESRRADEPLVALNAGTLSADLLGSQLFGHVKGAFTSADADHRGFFAQASGGTLFLDEIGELPLRLQSAFLRVLEEKVFQPLGSTKQFKTNVRIIAATNRNLLKDVAAGTFREDLFYRLETLTIQVPPLREHPEDIPLLVEHFLEQSRDNKGGKVKLDADVLPKLKAFSWPGNVRQLRTAIERAIAFADGNVLRADDFILERPELTLLFTDLHLEHIIEAAIRQALVRTGGNQVQAANLLGIARDTLINRMKKHGINRDELGL
ncbi:sigma-54-dependent Fis family transcriptional regulator [soil metagenome]